MMVLDQAADHFTGVIRDERHEFPSAPFAQFLAFGVFDACSLVQQCG